MKLPQPIQNAFERKVAFLTDENCEWQLELEGNDDYIKKIIGTEVVVIGNNGYGDYLFLKINPETKEVETPLFKFWHEGPEIDEVKDELECYLGLRSYPPSTTPIPKYSDGSDISIGDEIEFRSFFRKKNGEVTYITGISPLNYKIETVGIPEIEVELPCGTRYKITATENDNRFKKSLRKI